MQLDIFFKEGYSALEPVGSARSGWNAY